MTEGVVRQDVERGLYEFFVDGRLGGLVQYLDRGVERVFVHTETEPGYEGQGLATELVRKALESTRAEGMRIVAVCPFVAAWVGRHHDFDDILDPIAAHHPSPR
jgi:predicted GNAT family acetyltransferase